MSSKSIAAEKPSGYLLNLTTRDVVPANKELVKDIATGKFRRLSEAEANRRLGIVPSAPETPALRPDAKPIPGAYRSPAEKMTAEQLDEAIQLLQSLRAAKAATPDPDLDQEPDVDPDNEEPDEEEQEEEEGGETSGGLDPAVRASIDEALDRAEDFRQAKNKDGLETMARDEFSIELDKRKNIVKMLADFRTKLADTFGITL